MRPSQRMVKPLRIPMKSNIEEQLGTEEILDEGDFFPQSHGISPPRFSVISNNNPKAIGSIFASSRQSIVQFSVPQSKAISPRNIEPMRAEMSPESFALHNFNSGHIGQRENTVKHSPIKLNLKPCDESSPGGLTMNRDMLFPTRNHTAMEDPGSKNVGFSGDLLNVDSPRSNGSVGNGLSNRMEGLNNS